MPIQFRCPVCSHLGQVEDHLAGQTIKCPQCTQALTVPMPPPPMPPQGDQTGGPTGVPQQQGANPYGSPQPYPMQPNQEGDAAMRMLIPIDRSIWAIIAGYLGLFSLICLPGPFAVICGIVAVWDIKKSNGKKHGLGRAWFGIVMGILGSLGLALGIIGAIVG